MTVETERLTVRLMSDSELGAMAEAEADLELKKAYLEMLEGCLTHCEERMWYGAWQISEKSSGAAVGDLCFKGLQCDGTVEIGYGIYDGYMNRGYATEAVGAMSRWALGQDMVMRVEAETEPDNAASQAVLRKSGFLPTGTVGSEGPRFVFVEK